MVIDGESENRFEKYVEICKDQQFLIAVIVGVVIGIISGSFLRKFDIEKDTVAIISFPGELFMRGLKLMVLPFIICCIIVGAGTLDITQNKKIAIYTLIIFVLTSMINVILGMVSVLIFRPGETELRTNESVPSVVTVETCEQSSRVVDGFLDIGRNIIPENLFQATFQQSYTSYKKVEYPDNSKCITKKKIEYRDGSNTIGIIFFCIAFGSILGTLGPEKQPVIEFFSTAYFITQKMLNGVIWFTPLAVCSIICGRVISVPNLLLALRQMSMFIVTTVGGLLFYQLIMLQLMHYAVVKRNPFSFYWNCMPPMAAVFATATKTVALPLTFQIMDEKLKVNPKISRFILPIGTINLNGTAFYLGAAMMFLAQLNNVAINMDQIITLVLACTVASMSSASVPGAAIILVVMLCSVVSIPTDDVGLLLTIDWFLDRVRSVNNLLGDCYTISWVEHLSHQRVPENIVKNGKQDIENGVTETFSDDYTEHQKYQNRIPNKNHSPTLH